MQGKGGREERSTADSIPVIPADTTREPAEEETAPEILTQYASVYEQNPDLFGWICIEDTVLDYPVMPYSGRSGKIPASVL